MREWFAAIDGWSRQYDDGKGGGVTQPMDRDDYDDLWAAARETQRKAGLIN